MFRRFAHLIRGKTRDLEYDPETQWRFHRRMTWFWVANFPVVALLYFGFPRQWVVLGLLVNTFYSLYANFDTEFDGVHSSYAAWKADEIRASESKVTNDHLAEKLDAIIRMLAPPPPPEDQ